MAVGDGRRHNPSPSRASALIHFKVASRSAPAGTPHLRTVSQKIVDDHCRDDSHPKPVNMTHALCAMKDALVRLLTRANPVELLRRLIEILADTVEPIRPGRSNPRRKGPRLHGYYMAYKPCS